MYTQVIADRKQGKSVDALVVPLFADRKVGGEAGGRDEVKRALKRADTRGDQGAMTVVDAADGSRIVLWGLGERAKLDAEKVRSAADALVKRLDGMRAQKVSVETGDAANGQLDAETFGRALGEGAGIAAFVFDTFKGETTRREREKNGDKPRKLSLHVSDKRAQAGLEDGLGLAESTNFARQLAATPPNVATTTYIAEQARKLGASSPRLKCNVYSGKQLERMKLVGLQNVGKASENPPCLIELIYSPPTGGKNKKSRGTVLIVGKTMAYDSGGLSLKINNGMLGMKYDKCGGMAVLGAMHALARLQPDCRVIGLMPTAENSVSDEAMRPDDIITYRNGVTCEVTNTDAEGRLILADALVYGTEEHKVDAVIDLATLTGGVIVALGRTFAGYWCEDAKLRERLEAASAASGERIWRLPMHEAYRKQMKSQHADILNSSPVRDAHPIQGAAFLTYFVPENMPWAHIDIAGTADGDKPNPPFSAGPTGYGVRLLVELLRNWK